MKYLPIIISGPSGVGKSTIISKLLKDRKDLEITISYTTRKMREKEQNGVHYNFINNEKFNDLVKNDKFIEYQEVHKNLYGTPIFELKRIAENLKFPILDIDVKGAKSVYNYGFKDSLFCFIKPLNFADLENRFSYF